MVPRARRWLGHFSYKPARRGPTPGVAALADDRCLRTSPTARYRTISDPMPLPAAPTANAIGSRPGAVSASGGAVSWGAIAAGAAAAAALSLILLILGTGLGLAAVSPWRSEGIAATHFGVSTVAWLALTQLLASGPGGYLAGRLRTRWSDTPHDEVYFRDTAHGFLAWAVSSLATAALLGSVVGSLVGTGTRSAVALAAPALQDAGLPSAYLLDGLFRPEPGAKPAAGDTAAPAAQAEAGRIIANALRIGALPADDARYVGQLVAQHTGLSPADGERRARAGHARAQLDVIEAQAAVRDAADNGRKHAAYAALWLFASLLLGAFVAAWGATFGGRRRDL